MDSEAAKACFAFSGAVDGGDDEDDDDDPVARCATFRLGGADEEEENEAEDGEDNDFLGDNGVRALTG